MHFKFFENFINDIVFKQFPTLPAPFQSPCIPYSLATPIPFFMICYYMKIKYTSHFEIPMIL